MFDKLSTLIRALPGAALSSLAFLTRLTAGLGAGGMALYLTHWIPWGFDWLDQSHQQLFIQHWSQGTIDQTFLFSGLFAFCLATPLFWFLSPPVFRMSFWLFNRLTRRLRLTRQLQAGSHPSTVRQDRSIRTRTAAPRISRDNNPQPDNPRPEEGPRGGVTGNTDNATLVAGATAHPLTSDNPGVEIDVNPVPQGDDQTLPHGTSPAESPVPEQQATEEMETERLPDSGFVEQGKSLSRDDAPPDDEKAANRLLTAMGPIMDRSPTMDRSSETSAAIPDQAAPDDQAAPVQNKGDMAACCVRFLAVAGYQPLIVEPASPGRISMFGMDDQSILAFCLLPDSAVVGEGPYQNAITAARRVPPILFRALRNDHILPEEGEIWEDVPALQVRIYVIGSPGSSPPPQLTGIADLNYLTLPSPLPDPDGGIEDWSAWCPSPIAESYRTIPDQVLHRFLESTFRNG